MSFVCKSNDMNHSLWDSRHSAESLGSAPVSDTVHHLQNDSSVDGSIRVHHNSVSLICQFLFLLITEWKEHLHCRYSPIKWFIHPSRRFLDYSTILCLVPRSRSASALEYWWFRLYRSHFGHWICFCLQVEVSGGTCSDGSIRKSLSVVGQGPGHVYCCGWRQTGILKWYILLGNARCAQREKNCTHSHCYSKAEVERKAQAAGNCTAILL